MLSGVLLVLRVVLLQRSLIATSVRPCAVATPVKFMIQGCATASTTLYGNLTGVATAQGLTKVAIRLHHSSQKADCTSPVLDPGEACRECTQLVTKEVWQEKQHAAQRPEQ